MFSPVSAGWWGQWVVSFRIPEIRRFWLIAKIVRNPCVPMCAPNFIRRALPVTRNTRINNWKSRALSYTIPIWQTLLMHQVAPPRMNSSGFTYQFAAWRRAQAALARSGHAFARQSFRLSSIASARSSTGINPSSTCQKPVTASCPARP